MLSEETTLGSYPVEAVQMMTRIALKTEPGTCSPDHVCSYDEMPQLSDVVAQAGVSIAHDIDAKYIVALTKTGEKARMIARYRPCQQVIALVASDKDAQQLVLSYGCYPIVAPQFKSIEEVMDLVRASAVQKKLAKKGDKVVIVAGMPVGKAKETNMTLVETI